MVDESKKTGNVFHFEPLRDELNDTFGVMKNVTPDSVFSNLKGLQVNPNSDSTEADEGAEEQTPPVEPSTSNTDDTKDKKKTAKSNEITSTYEICQASKCKNST